MEVLHAERIERRRSYHERPGREEKGRAFTSCSPLIRDTLQHASIGPESSQAMMMQYDSHACSH